MADGSRTHRKCAEVALISDRLRGTGERDNIKISTPEDIHRVMSGALVYSLQIGEQDSPTGLRNHGDCKEPCRSCSRILPLVGVTAHTQAREICQFFPQQKK
ncbi:YwqJ-related putative deaminase [Streptomyces sp. NPDC005791]|uniref:YwqJ-related putative deaminase n=1 Tax=Streptomyces sp. NPDC005791 TaxID=3364732 RepID=UPI00369C1D18